MSDKRTERKWDREEVVILVVEYFRTKNLSSEEIQKTHQGISEFLRNREEMLTGVPVSDIFRNYAGIHMQSSRIRCLDSETQYSGMQGTKLQKEIVQEYLNNPDKITAEAEQIYEKYGKNNMTISYYNQNADQYFRDTVDVDMSECCDRFIKYVIPGGKIIDIGAGSGRDVKYFKDRGFDVEAIDASEELCRLATEYTGIHVQYEKIQDWSPSRVYDGIWANASLLHLGIDEIEEFICKVSDYLQTGGALYISIKKGINNGYDSNGRFFTSFSEENVQQIVAKSTAYEIAELWHTVDKMNRDEVQWLNLILKRIKK
ncbi:MAG: class I SAM-dependent methyltransferase [Acetatifactor sp.]|nr:class I SAM-dependent methyltransferase [Acetatifactor sp.]